MLFRVALFGCCSTSISVLGSVAAILFLYFEFVLVAGWVRDIGRADDRRVGLAGLRTGSVVVFGIRRLKAPPGLYYALFVCACTFGDERRRYE